MSVLGTRHIVVSGPPGVGKTTVGRALAAALHRPFFDSDALIEARNGMSVRDFFRRHGEKQFRVAEEFAVEELVATTHLAVIAVGGGALCNGSLRKRILSSAHVVSLDASLDALLARLANEPLNRPILDVLAPREALSKLLLERRAAYNEAHLVVDTSTKAVEDVVAEIARGASHARVLINLDERSYRAHIGVGVSEEIISALERFREHLWVIDETVARVQADSQLVAYARTQPHVVVNAREKKLGVAESIWNAAERVALSREKSVMIACGGGGVGDATGFAASTWKRGVSWINIPTTSLAMVDSCIGGKTGIDFGAAKNSIGTFHQPAEVFVDPIWLRTQPMSAQREGLAEALKCAVLAGEMEGFGEACDALSNDESLAWRNIIARALEVKARFVEVDEFDRDARHALNAGHTVGHVLERAYGMSHGVAVAHGLYAELFLCEATPEQQRLREVVRNAIATHLNITFDLNMSSAPLSHLFRADKKRVGDTVRVPIPNGRGENTFVAATIDELARAVFCAFGNAPATLA